MLSIGTLAKKAGLASSAIRYYEKAGLLPRAERRNGQRVYDADDLLRISLIVKARKLGWSIGELRRAGALAMPAFATPALAKNELARKRAALKLERDHIDARLSAIDGLKDCACASLDACGHLRA